MNEKDQKAADKLKQSIIDSVVKFTEETGVGISSIDISFLDTRTATGQHPVQVDLINVNIFL